MTKHEVDTRGADAPRPAIVLVSGGLDSATCLAIASAEGYRCHALSFQYGQRHHAEVNAARKVAARISELAKDHSSAFPKIVIQNT